NADGVSQLIKPELVFQPPPLLFYSTHQFSPEFSQIFRIFITVSMDVGDTKQSRTGEQNGDHRTDAHVMDW
ncbi:MAG: hypothetical protein ACPGSM_19710, partial [Thiolinea sp.]